MISLDLQNRLEKICAAAVKKFGSDHQFRKVQEECAELIAVINQWVDGRVYREAVAEEAADVIIMLAQLRLMLGEKSVDSFVAQKLERLEQRIDEKEKTKT